jgi:hypothetical protein
MDRAFADTVSSCATALAVIAVLGALLVAVIDANNPHNARVRPSAPPPSCSPRTRPWIAANVAKLPELLRKS